MTLSSAASTPRRRKRRSKPPPPRRARLGLNMCIAVTDEVGDLKAFHRMDGAPKLSIGISQDKAYTSASYGFPTHGWFDFIKDDPPLLHGITHTPRLIVFGGGYPIKERAKWSAPSASAAAITPRTWSARGRRWRRSTWRRSSDPARLRRSEQRTLSFAAPAAAGAF